MSDWADVKRVPAGELAAMVGRDFVSHWLTIDQARIDAFAKITEDEQFIHVDPERAAETAFGGTVAHGFLTLSLLPHLANSARRFDGARMGVNYGLNSVRFPKPVAVGSRIRASVTITEVTELPDGGLQLVQKVAVELEGSDKPACVAEWVTRSYY